MNATDRLFQSRGLRHVVVPSLPLLFLELDGDASDGAALQPLHQVGDETSNLQKQMAFVDLGKGFKLQESNPCLLLMEGKGATYHSKHGLGQKVSNTMKS